MHKRKHLRCNKCIETVRKWKASPAPQDQPLCPSYLGLVYTSGGLPHLNARPSPSPQHFLSSLEQLHCQQRWWASGFGTRPSCQSDESTAPNSKESHYLVNQLHQGWKMNNPHGRHRQTFSRSSMISTRHDQGRSVGRCGEGRRRRPSVGSRGLGGAVEDDDEGVGLRRGRGVALTAAAHPRRCPSAAHAPSRSARATATA